MAEAIGPGEAARRLGVSTRTVQRWLREGRLPGVQVGRRLKVDAAGLSARPGGRPIERLLVANRGELVVRIARTCHRLGIRSLALVSPDQARASWADAADERVPLAGSYLDAERVLMAAKAAGADAIHPGYGFLAENADFAEAVDAAGITWVGPPPAAMRALGDKAAARRLARRVGVPVLAGYEGAAQSDAALARAARRIGYPLIVKPSAGGGGKGMHVVEAAAQLREALGRARREAAAAFGDERLVLERQLDRPRHIEVQLLVDRHGAAVHLGERECSLQRRHQKVVEEAPSPVVGARLRRRLGAAAIELARAAGYAGAGTAEFLLDDGEFYFLELNARLQVEHPVTELVTGRDLVADQLRIAAGEPLGFEQRDVTLDGHAIEARLYAEDPWADFLPATGELLDVRWPAGEAVRVDAGVGAGDVIGARYDPLLAKLIAHAPDRAAALERLDAALEATVAFGVTTNRGFLRWLLARPEVAAGRIDTQLIDRLWRPAAELPDEAWPVAAALLASEGGGGWRLNAPSRVRVEIDGETRAVAPVAAAAPATAWARQQDGRILLDVDGRALIARLVPPPTVEAAVRRAGHAGVGSQMIDAPMPGSVIAVHVSEGDAVEQGQPLVVLEAMKMENAVPAPAAGRVERLLVEAGQQVSRGQPLVELA
ncbi:MAG TPA: DUF3182 family protein [Candidatus Limnocylindria bacterium]|nr:DUF3182 family protein [Candidatus Limnocylindria bacterium]